jgi:outer membrane protein assembly factor BamB
MKRLALTLSITAASLAVTDAQWPQWRGPDRTSVVPAAAVPKAWPAKPTIQWTQPLGEGYSSPVVDDGRVFVHSRTDPDEVIGAFKLASGEPIWSASYGSAFTKNSQVVGI